MATPRLIFIHGIGGQRDADEYRVKWATALADGAAHAGHGTFSRALLNDEFDVEFVSYASLFVEEKAEKQQQGDEFDLSGAEQEITTDFFREVVEARREVVPESDERTHAMLDDAAARLDPPGEPQGVLAPVKTLINVATTLVSVPPMRRTGQWLTAKAMVWDFSQVARYLARAEARDGETLDVRIRRRLLDAVGDGPAVVVAHSLGSVVALETLHEVQADIPLFVTIGSPIGMRAAVWPRIRPQKPRVPERVGAWSNYWDRDDIIAVNPVLEKRLQANGAGLLPESRRVDSDGVWVHDATKYLAQGEVAGRVAEAMAPR